MITIIAYNVTFGAAYSLRRAFSLREDTRLITMDSHKLWPDEDDLILTDDTAAECKKLIQDSRFTMIAGASCIHWGMLKKLGGRQWKAWAKKQRWVPFWGDTAYWDKPQIYNDLMHELKVKTTFAMMDLMSRAPKEAIPLCHPIEDLGMTRKPPWLSVMHSPRSQRKRGLKGTDIIERVMARICEEFPMVDYQTIMNTHYRECLRIKQDAHIFIDQVPAKGQPAGLGRSGEEALANGSVVFTALHGEEYLNGYFEPPPVVRVYDEAQLYIKMRYPCQVDRGEIEAIGQVSRRWAEQYLLFPGWLDYVGRYL